MGLKLLSNVIRPCHGMIRFADLISTETQQQIYEDFPYEVYTDGSACDESGGIAAVLVKGNFILREISQRFIGPEVTNVRMEVMAVLVALREFKYPQMTIYSDYQLLSQGCELLRRHERVPDYYIQYKNADLWYELATEIVARPGVTVQWVEGHSGRPGNTLANRLALRQARGLEHYPTS
ncbi:MAG: Ribonuclease HI [bacterium ADurb.Bin400]|nr:MAG: Ribonuclease HI [bacterium ADurb.Bin400]